MKHENYKADDSDEIVWLRLNRLKSVRLCEKLIRQKNDIYKNDLLTDEMVTSKAVGLSSAIQSAIGYWQVKPQSLNAKILSRYYFLLQMTIAEQVSNPRNLDDLKNVQRHTEMGHGLGTIVDPARDFPNNYFVFLMASGHFSSYVKSIGYDLSQFAFSQKPKIFDKISSPSLLVPLSELFRRIPELSKIVEEHLGESTLAFHVGHSFQNTVNKVEAAKKQIDKTGKLTLTAPPERDEHVSVVDFYVDTKLITTEYLTSLKLPFEDFQYFEEGSHKYITAKIRHSASIHWHEHLQTYTSPYATQTFVLPLWTPHYDSILVNYALLYALSIIVRYQPDLWYRLTSADLNHLGSLIEYYVSVIDHILPLQMLERISGSKVEIHNQGSLFGQI